MGGKRAIVDIGSNTVRLVVYEGPPRAPDVILNEKVTARLGKEVARSGQLSDKAMAGALVGLTRFAKLIDLMDVPDVDVVATAAVRDATNGGEFLERVRQLGMKPRILSGEEEARVSAMGVIAAFHKAWGTTADLGGGSLELTHIDDGECGSGVTLPLGTLRIPGLRESGDAQFGTTVRQMVDKSGWSGGKDRPFFLVGGSFRAFAIYAMHKLDSPLDDPHGFEIAAQDARKICKAIAQGRIDDVERISSSRMASLPDAAVLLDVLIGKIQPSRLVFSSWGLREGLLYSKLDAETQAQNPILAGIAAFSQGLGVTAAEAATVADWTAAVAASSEDDEPLRQSAAMLALGGMRTEPNLRADQAMGWALRKRWIGLDARGRAMIAMAVLANSGQRAIPEIFANLAGKEDLEKAIAWGLAVRLCRRLTAETAEAMAGTALRLEGKQLMLEVSEPLHALVTDSTSKDLRLLADFLGLDSDVRLLPRRARA
ncbi:MAG: Ppx/GppA family phosphatase [Novosphingobium sp.]|nr:Ppx/GppA family phosphatase [Novosphingobium sp.]